MTTHEKLPGTISPQLLAAERQSLHGSYALSEMPRIGADMIPQPDSAVTFRLHFKPVANGEVRIEGQIEFCCMLLCVRCMQAFSNSVKNEIKWQTVADWNDARRLPPGVEPLPAAGNAVKLRDLIEDEILLALPENPKHAENCPLPTKNEV